MALFMPSFLANSLMFYMRKTSHFKFKLVSVEVQIHI